MLENGFRPIVCICLEREGGLQEARIISCEMIVNGMDDLNSNEELSAVAKIQEVFLVPLAICRDYTFSHVFSSHDLIYYMMPAFEMCGRAVFPCTCILRFLFISSLLR